MHSLVVHAGYEGGDMAENYITRSATYGEISLPLV